MLIGLFGFIMVMEEWIGGSGNVLSLFGLF